ncbi:MAG: PAS domain S-box protein [Syntrophales bacterium]
MAWGGGGRLYGYTTVGSGIEAIHVSVGIPEQAVHADVKRQMARNFTLLGLVSVLALVGAWFFGEILIISPVSRLIDVTKEKIRIFSNAVEGAIDGIAITDMKGIITYANPAMEDMYGYNKGELLEKSVAILDSNPERVNEIMSAMIKTGSWNSEVESIKKNKEIFPVLLSLSTITDDKGNPMAMMGAIKDITKRKQSEEELLKSEEQYRSLVENIDFGVTLIDKDFKIILTNAVLGKWFNKPIREFAGKNCFREFEKRQAVCPHCPGTKAMATGRPHQVETECVRDDGSPISALVHAFPLFYPDLLKLLKTSPSAN